MADAPSGHPDSFATADREEAAAALAEILRDEAADVLTTYDPAGGYGHPDHIAVHFVGARAAELAGTPRVLQATVDRKRLLGALRLLKVVARPLHLPGDFDPDRFRSAYTDHAALTHRIDVGRYIGVKRQAMQAHESQGSADFGARTLTICLKLPKPLFRLGFRYEWFVETGARPVHPLVDDVFQAFGGAVNRLTPMGIP